MEIVTYIVENNIDFRIPRRDWNLKAFLIIPTNLIWILEYLGGIET